MEGAERLRVECQCGWNAEGGREDVVSSTKQHVMKSHWVEIDDEDVIEMATPI
jgi:hypothetical protein